MAKKSAEREIQEACCDLLALDGWRRLRCETVSRREWGKGFGEPGMPDDLFIRYRERKLLVDIANHSDGVQYSDVLPVANGSLPTVHLIWIEWKAKNGRTSAYQRAWHLRERLRGASTYIAGKDFQASVDGFLAWYRGSGWMRRPI